ncbi:hypothetical protein HMPREF9446_03465 [Bacteroides fluxus YIT 12057]|uniref:Uncharacterized protein n=1 Tax=Bacteroides fluxus YIT 12057 TaxID=763034 RepID=F3PXG7_9BACE|nr:hypothetical protein HMPREF9446_03465 [Bacteroides fluxus YIT 12057]
MDIVFSFRPYLSVYYGLYPLYFTSVYIWYGNKVKCFYQQPEHFTLL